MPPASQQLAPRPTSDTSHMLAPRQRSGVGATVGIIIILILIVLGALYFLGAYLNNKNSVDELPFIPGDNSTEQTG